MKEELEKLLKKYWGYEKFRPGQLDIIESIIRQRYTLALLTTGGGKSICYQIAGLHLGGVTIVISPLISLMQDQVQRLKSLGLEASVYNSTLNRGDKDQVCEDLSNGVLQFLYLAPESLQNKNLRRVLANCRVSLLAVDEAHCVSMWGHDFRPAYLRIMDTLKGFPWVSEVHVAAFTATATHKTRKDIVKQLGMSSPKVFTNSFTRENLAIEVVGVGGIKKEKVDEIIRRRIKIGPILIYSGTRKRVEELANRYLAEGYSSAYYHGGMKSEERQRVQDGFLADEYDLVVATNAFGMGVDKPNIRTVFHDMIPDSIENFYQEAGRAGRDGQPCWSFIYYNWKSVNLRHQMLENNYVDSRIANLVYNCLRKSKSQHLTWHKVLTSLSNVNQPQIKKCLEIMSDKGILSGLEIGDVSLKFELNKPNIIFLDRIMDLPKQKRIFNLGNDKLKSLVKMCLGSECRMRFILGYFGEKSGMCGKCDNCLLTDTTDRLNHG